MRMPTASSEHFGSFGPITEAQEPCPAPEPAIEALERALAAETANEQRLLVHRDARAGCRATRSAHRLAARTT